MYCVGAKTTFTTRVNKDVSVGVTIDRTSGLVRWSMLTSSASSASSSEGSTALGRLRPFRFCCEPLPPPPLRGSGAAAASAGLPEVPASSSASLLAGDACEGNQLTSTKSSRGSEAVDHHTTPLCTP